MTDLAHIIDGLRALGVWSARRREAINTTRRNVVLRAVLGGKRSIMQCRCCTNPQCLFVESYRCARLTSLSQSFP